MTRTARSTYPRAVRKDRYVLGRSTTTHTQPTLVALSHIFLTTSTLVLTILLDPNPSQASTSPSRRMGLVPTPGEPSSQTLLRDLWTKMNTRPTRQRARTKSPTCPSQPLVTFPMWKGRRRPVIGPRVTSASRTFSTRESSGRGCLAIPMPQVSSCAPALICC